MSLTIIPNRKTKKTFFTNISYENFLGEVCHLAGAKCFIISGFVKMAYSMTNNEANEAIIKLKQYDTSLEYERLYNLYFNEAPHSNKKQIVDTEIQNFINFLEELSGYKTI